MVHEDLGLTCLCNGLEVHVFGKSIVNAMIRREGAFSIGLLQRLKKQPRINNGGL